MRAILTVSLPQDLLHEVNQMSQRFHLNKSDLVKNAIRKYIWNLRFKALRAKAVPRARKMGYLTDEDVFEQVS